MAFSQAHSGAAAVLVDECAPADSGGQAPQAAEFIAANSTLACLQTYPDFAGFIVGEENARLLKSLLYLEDR
jgi:hypothetical protein